MDRSQTNIREHTSERSRFHPDDSGADVQVYAASLQLDAVGRVLRISTAAGRLLGYADPESHPAWFFSLVHGTELPRIMKDISEIVCHGRRGCTWLTRLKTAPGKWKPFRLNVYSRLDEPSADLIVFLRPVTGAIT